MQLRNVLASLLLLTASVSAAPPGHGQCGDIFEVRDGRRSGRSMVVRVPCQPGVFHYIQLTDPSGCSLGDKTRGAISISVTNSDDPAAVLGSIPQTSISLGIMQTGFFVCGEHGIDVTVGLDRAEDGKWYGIKLL